MYNNFRLVILRMKLQKVFIVTELKKLQKMALLMCGPLKILSDYLMSISRLEKQIGKILSNKIKKLLNQLILADKC